MFPQGLSQLLKDRNKVFAVIGNDRLMAKSTDAILKPAFHREVPIQT